MSDDSFIKDDVYKLGFGLTKRSDHIADAGKMVPDYHALRDAILAALVETKNYDDLFQWCMAAINAKDLGSKEVIEWRSIETDPPDGSREVWTRSMSGCWKARYVGYWQFREPKNDDSTILWWCEIPRGPR